LNFSAGYPEANCYSTTLQRGGVKSNTGIILTVLTVCREIWKSLKRLRWVVWHYHDTTLKRGAGTKRQNQTSDIGYLTSDINSLPAPLLLPFPQGSRWEKGRTGRRDYRDDLSFLNQIPFNPRQIETAQLYELWALYELYELPILYLKPL
jgi:hypothetical protein